jgi:signal transduction histidine kinase
MNSLLKGLAGAALVAFATIAAAETDAEAKAMLAAATSELAAKGVAGAAKEFNAGGKWRGKNAYVVLVEFNGNMLAHADNIKLVGKNMLEAKDATGRPFVQETIKTVQARAESNIDLRWANPNTKKIDSGKLLARRVPGQDAYVGIAYFE